jgi:hypothetical protein
LKKLLEQPEDPRLHKRYHFKCKDRLQKHLWSKRSGFPGEIYDQESEAEFVVDKILVQEKALIAD